MPFSKPQKKVLKALGERIRELRKQKGLTQKELAHSIGKDAQAIQRVETGLVNPGLLFMLQICEGLEIDIKALLSNLSE